MAACWYHFSIVFVPSFLFYLLCAYVSLRPTWPFSSVLLPFAHLLFVILLGFASQTLGLCSAFSLAPFSLAHVLFAIWVCFASQTPVLLCSASRLGSPLPCTPFSCYVSVLRLASTGFVWCFFLRLPSPLHTFYLLCECASPHKHRVRVVPLSSPALSLARVLFVM